MLFKDNPKRYKRLPSILKILGTLILAGIFCFCIIPVTINKLFKIPAWNEWFHVQWQPEDSLSYVGGVLSFIGTMFLGWVSWTQNQSLQHQQEDAFIAENSSAVFLERILFYHLDKTICSFNLHPECLLATSVNTKTPLDYSSIECVIELTRQNSVPAAIRVVKTEVYTEKSVFEFHAIDDCYSRTITGLEVSRFQIALIMSHKEKQDFGEIFRSPSFDISITLEIISDKYISSLLKCKSSLRRLTAGEIIIFEAEKETTRYIWYKSNIVSRNSITYRTESTEDIPNE